MILVFLTAIAFAPAVHAECASRASVAELSAETGAAWAAFSDMDMESFGAHRDRARGMIPCLADAPSPADAASYLRVEALDAFSAGRDAESARLFLSLLTVQPSWRPPSTMAPDGGPLDMLVKSAVLAGPVPAARLPRLTTGRHAVANGIPGGTCPEALPCLVVVVEPTGLVSWSAMISTVEAIPVVYVAPARESVEEPRPVQQEEEDAPRAKRHPWALVGLGAAALVATPLLASSSARAGSSADTLVDRCGDPCTDREADADILEFRSRQKTLGWSAAGTGVLAAGLGFTVMLTW